jgi:hypothetical protein
MIYPGNPVHFKVPSQLIGLEKGEFILQPKWDGRRAIYNPASGLWYKSGKLVDAKPWKNHKIQNTTVVQDLELMRDRAIILDIIIPGITLGQRLKMAAALGLDIMWFPVSSATEVKAYFKQCRSSGICDGVVLKRKNSLYLAGQGRQLDCADWVKVKDESIHLLG